MDHGSVGRGPRGGGVGAASAAHVDLVELDVVALDRAERPVTDLRQEDFAIKDDGRPVELKTFAKVTALGSTQPDDARVVTLLMDDIGVSAAGTSPMQQIAPVVLAPMGNGDEVSVVRLSSRSDEAIGDVNTARDRIAGDRGGAQPFQKRDTPETVLKAIARIARQLETIDHRRKVILCLGLPSVCDVSEPPLGGTSPYLTAWVAAIADTARANASVYVVDPTGGRGGLARGGALLPARLLAAGVEARDPFDRGERRAQRRPPARAAAPVISPSASRQSRPARRAAR